MKHTYLPSGVCARQIDFELVDGCVRNLVFTAGCNGNLKAIAKLVDGMEAGRVIELLRGNTCGGSSTSCADQLSLAIMNVQQTE